MSFNVVISTLFLMVFPRRPDILLQFGSSLPKYEWRGGLSMIFPYASVATTASFLTPLR